jgi:aryl-alcohol dehydrogenase-like predicted oxidoreductase
VAYSPLGRGFLTGRFATAADLPPDDYRHHAPRFQGGNFATNLAIVARVRELASDKKCTPAQLALAWVLYQGTDIVPIPGTKRRRYLEENIAALEIVLSAADLQRLDEIAPPGIAAGTRYPGAAMSMVNG